MVAAAARVGERWREGATIDVQREMARLTLAIVGETLFSADLEPEADEVGDALTDSLDGLNLFMLPHTDALERLPLPLVRRFHAARRRLDDTIARLAARPAGGPPREVLVSTLLRAAREDGWSDDELRDEAMTILLAGHETTASALTSTWYLLACHPRAEAELADELDRVLADRLPTAADVPRLRYAEMVVSESMRLYPPAWLIGRRALVDYDLDGYRIPRGSIVIMSPYVTHRDPRCSRARSPSIRAAGSRRSDASGRATRTSRSAAARGCASARRSRGRKRSSPSRRSGSGGACASRRATNRGSTRG